MPLSPETQAYFDEIRRVLADWKESADNDLCPLGPAHIVHAAELIKAGLITAEFGAGSVIYLKLTPAGKP